MKSVRIWSFPGPYFPTFGLNTERYGEYGHFLRSKCFKKQFFIYKFNPLVSDGDKSSCILKETCSCKLLLCLSMYDLLSPPQGLTKNIHIVILYLCYYIYYSIYIIINISMCYVYYDSILYFIIIYHYLIFLFYGYLYYNINTL